MGVCEELLDNPILCNILIQLRDLKHFMILVDEDGNEQCHKSDFSFTYKFKGVTPIVTIQQEGDYIGYQVLIRTINDSGNEIFKEFKNLIGVPKFLFHAGEITSRKNGQEFTYAVARRDDEIIHYQENAFGRFMTVMLSLREFLRGLPPDFLAPDSPSK